MEVVQHLVYLSTATGTCQSTKNVRFRLLAVVSRKQVHECAALKVVCAMSSGSPFDRSRLARRMANLDIKNLYHGSFLNFFLPVDWDSG